MPEPLGDPLARAARWDALRRRVVAGTAAHPTGIAPTGGGGAGGGGAADPPVRELAEAARRVLTAHPDVSVTITVEAAGGSSTVRFHWSGDQLVVTMTEAGQAADQNGRHHGPTPQRDRGQAAAQLAELLRRDPSLLSGPDQPGG